MLPTLLHTALCRCMGVQNCGNLPAEGSRQPLALSPPLLSRLRLLVCLGSHSSMQSLVCRSTSRHDAESWSSAAGTSGPYRLPLNVLSEGCHAEILLDHPCPDMYCMMLVGSVCLMHPGLHSLPFVWVNPGGQQCMLMPGNHFWAKDRRGIAHLYANAEGKHRSSPDFWVRGLKQPA